MKSQGRLLLLAIIAANLLIVMAVLGLRLAKSHQPSETAVQSTSSPQTQPGLVVFGNVRSSTGRGIDHVTIYRSYASYPGEQIAVTDAGGYYQSDFFGIPGDEMVSVQAVQEGLEFAPVYCYWRHYAGYEMKACDFVAIVKNPVYLPLVNNAPR